MNQNPPRGPGNPYDGAERKDPFGLDQNTMNNQQGHRPPPPPGGGYPLPPGGHFPPPYSHGHGTNPQDTAVMTTKEWLMSILIFLIPCIGWLIGIVMLFVWGFSGSGNLNRRNLARAVLIVIAILIGLYLLSMLFFGAMILNMLRMF